MMLPDAAPHQPVQVVAAAQAAPAGPRFATCSFVLARASSETASQPLQLAYSALMREYPPKPVPRAQRGTPTHATQEELQAIQKWDHSMKVTVVRAPVHGRMGVDVHVLPQAELSMVTNVPEHQLRKYCGTTEYIWRINSGPP